MRSCKLLIVVVVISLIVTSFSSGAAIISGIDQAINTASEGSYDNTIPISSDITEGSQKRLISSVEKIAGPELGFDGTAATLNDEVANNRLSLSYIFEKPVVSEVEYDDTVYSRIGIPNLYCCIGNPGNPSLPIKGAYILLPHGKQMVDIIVTPEEKHDIVLPYVVEPVAEPVLSSRIDDSALLQPDEAIYNSQELFPGKFFDLVGQYRYHGYNIVVLSLYPVQYKPADSILTYCPELTVTVYLGESEAKYPLFNGAKKHLEDIVTKVDNPAVARTYLENRTDPVNTETYNLLIITTDSVKHGFEPLKNAHDAEGTETMIYSVEAIVSNPEYWVNGTWGDNNPGNPFCEGDLGGNYEMFNDTQAKIRNFIRHAYVNWSIEYVLLGGDIESVPARLFACGPGPLAPSDLYYGCLEGCYNSKADRFWGQENDGQDVTGGTGDVDLFAEVYVGRACVDNMIDVGYFVNKTIAYMNTDDADLTQVVMAGQYLTSYVMGGDYLDDLVHYIPSGDSGYNITKLYDRDWPGFDFSHPFETGWPKEKIIDHINNGTYMIHNVAHATVDNVMKMTITDVHALTNDKFCFIYSQGCSAGAFDFPIGDLTDDCIAEYLTIKTAHGAFAGIMNARDVWIGKGQPFHREFLDALFNENITTFGKAHQDSREDTIYSGEWTRYHSYGLNFFGDPSLSIKRPYLATHNLSVKTFAAPNHITCDKVVYVNTTILNTGQNDEENVLVSLQVNGYGIDNVTIPWFSSLSAQDVSFTWRTPIEAGVYDVAINVTAPGAIEEYYGDNEQSQSVRVGVWNINTNELFNTVQEAIDDNDTVDGHTILVPSGVYHEQIWINKDVLLMGENRETTIIESIPGSSVIQIHNTTLVNITRFTIKNGTHGVSIGSSTNITIINTTITDNTAAGVSLTSSHDVTINGNKISKGDYGIHLADFSCNNRITDNDIIGNQEGIVVDASSNHNFIYHNDFNNTLNAYDAGSINHWDNGYLYGTHCGGGNWWSDYNGSDRYNGPEQDGPDPDGIGDTPYNILGGDSHDQYPLMNPWSGRLPSFYYVDDDNTDGPWNGTPSHPFQHIQEGIDRAIPGDTVFVVNGTYYEHLLVEKTINLIGEDRNETIIDCDGNKAGVCVSADRVRVSEFTIQNAICGINIESNHNIVSDNIITYIEYGINISKSHKNLISGNTLLYNDRGIYLGWSYSNNITGNNITKNTNTTLRSPPGGQGNTPNTLSESPPRNLRKMWDPDIEICLSYGICLHKSSTTNRLQGNTISNNLFGIHFDSRMPASGDNIINGNTIRNNSYGIWIEAWPYSYSNRFFHNNFIHNGIHARNLYTLNYWDNGYPSGGNYWDDYTGTDEFSGPEQNEPDPDGIGDTPYEIYKGYTSIFDNYPLMTPWRPG